VNPVALLWIVGMALVLGVLWAIGGEFIRAAVEGVRDRRLRRQLRDPDPAVRDAALREVVAWARRVLAPAPRVTLRTRVAAWRRAHRA